MKFKKVINYLVIFGVLFLLNMNGVYAEEIPFPPQEGEYFTVVSRDLNGAEYRKYLGISKNFDSEDVYLVDAIVGKIEDENIIADILENGEDFDRDALKEFVKKGLEEKTLSSITFPWVDLTETTSESPIYSYALDPGYVEECTLYYGFIRTSNSPSETFNYTVPDEILEDVFAFVGHKGVLYDVNYFKDSCQVSKDTDKEKDNETETDVENEPGDDDSDKKFTPEEQDKIRQMEEDENPKTSVGSSAVVITMIITGLGTGIYFGTKRLKKINGSINKL